jgi:hypothetical protein
MILNNPANISEEVIATLSDGLRAQIPLYNQNLQPRLYATATICFAAACGAIGLRFYSRRLKCQKSGWDDYTILGALGFYVPFYAVSTFCIVRGIGRHEVVSIVEDPGYIQSAAKAGIIAKVLYLFPLYFVKVSFPYILQ